MALPATSLISSTSSSGPFTHASFPHKPLQTYYRIFGTFSSDTIPTIIIHGGPGFSHNYLLPHRALFDTYSRPVIFYDQIGSGLSSHLPETADTTAYPDFWTVDIFVSQLHQLLAHLHLDGPGAQYDILGHSWGGMLASYFASLKPAGLRRLVLVNAAASKAASIANRLRSRKLLSAEMQEVLNEAERNGDWESREAKKVMGEFEKRFVCLVQPPPEDVMASVRAFGENMTVARTIGDDTGNPFSATGYMASWTMVGKAKNITVPTLVINGINEFASGDAVKPFLDEIPDVRGVTLEGTTHSPHFERKDEYMKVVGDFLTQP